MRRLMIKYKNTIKELVIYLYFVKCLYLYFPTSVSYFNLGQFTIAEGTECKNLTRIVILTFFKCDLDFQNYFQ